MILTIEPGIYCDENDKSIPKKYRGIGIRIEDDILVTKSGNENLSSGIVKSIEDIEMFSLSKQKVYLFNLQFIGTCSVSSLLGFGNFPDKSSIVFIAARESILEFEEITVIE